MIRNTIAIIIITCNINNDKGNQITSAITKPNTITRTVTIIFAIAMRITKYNHEHCCTATQLYSYKYTDIITFTRAIARLQWQSRESQIPMKIDICPLQFKL